MEDEKDTDLPHVAWLEKHGACKRGIRFARQFKTIQEAWDACERLDDLVWLAYTAASVRITGSAHQAGWEDAPFEYRDDLREACEEIEDAQYRAEQEEKDEDGYEDEAAVAFRRRVPCPGLT